MRLCQALYCHCLSDHKRTNHSHWHQEIHTTATNMPDMGMPGLFVKGGCFAHELQLQPWATGLGLGRVIFPTSFSRVRLV
ncbi:MAG: hypothetical protein MJE68_31505 [Proteobacteria bacterium]|nr:hypothetical protein [Pseudomonadota bacterium]